MNVSAGRIHTESNPESAGMIGDIFDNHILDHFSNLFALVFAQHFVGMFYRRQVIAPF